MKKVTKLIKEDTHPDFVNYSYDEMRQDLLDIIRNMNLSEWSPDVIIGITRGGLVPATMLSHYFDIPMIPISLSLRDFKTDYVVALDEIDRTIKLDHNKFKNILVVDDILDSGSTIKQLSEIFNTLKKFDHHIVKYSTLFFNEANDSKFIPDYYSRKINKLEDDSWIVFPIESWWKNF